MNAEFQPSYASYSFIQYPLLSLSLQKSLKEVYGIDEHFSLLFDAPEPLIERFLLLSKTVRLVPPQEQKQRDLGEWDAVLKAPRSHRILFENDTLRVLDASVDPGETAPFHTHQWDSIMVILQGSRFKIEDQNGNLSVGEWGPSVERFEGSLNLESYTNIGEHPFRAIAFEIKK